MISNDRRQEIRRVLIADCLEQTEVAVRALDNTASALEEGEVERAVGTFQGVPDRVRYLNIVLTRLVQPPEPTPGQKPEVSSGPRP